VIGRLIGQFEALILKSVKEIEKLGLPGYRGDHSALRIVTIHRLANDCDQFVISHQSKISLADYTLNDVGSIFASVGEHRRLVVGRCHQDETRWKAEDTALMSHTMQHDSVISNFVAPGEFAATIDSKDDAVAAMIAIKRAAHDNVRERSAQETSKYVHLLAEMMAVLEMPASSTETTRYRQSARKDETRSDARSTQDSRNGLSRRAPALTEEDSHRQLIERHFAKQKASQTSEHMLVKDAKLSADRRTMSSLQKRRDSAEQPRSGLTDKELKSFIKEKEELMKLYPQLRDFDSSSLS
jgi:hypothetical protein